MSAGLLFSMVFFVSLISALKPSFCPNFADFIQIIMFSDLESDYVNPIDLCNKLNQVCG